MSTRLREAQRTRTVRVHPPDIAVTNRREIRFEDELVLAARGAGAASVRPHNPNLRGERIVRTITKGIQHLYKLTPEGNDSDSLRFRQEPVV